MWKNGVEFESANKAHKFHVGGRTQIDFGCTTPTMTCSLARAGPDRFGMA